VEEIIVPEADDEDQGDEQDGQDELEESDGDVNGDNVVSF
jgi:hypothetical protein